MVTLLVHRMTEINTNTSISSSGDGRGSSVSLVRMPNDSVGPSMLSLRTSHQQHRPCCQRWSSFCSDLPDPISLVFVSPTSPNSCTGLHPDRPRIPWYRRRKPFVDPEPGCVYVPTPDGQGLQIGRANEEESYISITLWHSPEHDRGQISFGVGFGADPTAKARFESAVFRVTFGYCDSLGNARPLSIRDLSPKDERGEATEVHFGKTSESNLSMSFGYPSTASVGGGGSLSTNATYIRKTAPRVRGHGIHTTTAEWTFQEDEGKAGQHGLNPQYNLDVTLSTASSYIWMEFWAKAVLVCGHGSWASRKTLKLGSAEIPYKRNIDLSNSSTTTTT